MGYGNAADIARFAVDPALGGATGKGKALKLRNLSGDIVAKNWTRSLVKDRMIAAHTGNYNTDRFIGSASPAVETPELVKHVGNSFNLLDEKNFSVLRFTSMFPLSYMTDYAAVRIAEVDLPKQFTRKNAESVVRMEQNSLLGMFAYAYYGRTLPSDLSYIDIYTADITGASTKNPLFCPAAQPHTYNGVNAQANMAAMTLTPSQGSLLSMNTQISQFKDERGWSLNAKPSKLITSADYGPLWQRELKNVTDPDTAARADNINQYLGIKTTVVIVNDLPLQTTIVETSLCEEEPDMFRIQRANYGDDIVKQAYDDDIEAWKYMISSYQRTCAPAGWAGYFSCSAA